MDLPRSTVHAYVSGKILAPVELLDRIVIALGATPAEQAVWSEAWFRIAKHQHERRQPDPVETGPPEPPAAPDRHGSGLVRWPTPRQLPSVPRVFAGRRDELAQLTAMLEAARVDGTMISAIAGVGGIGKTWLALHWAHWHLDRFPDGQLFVDLRGFSPNAQPMSPSAAVRGFLHALGVEPERIPLDPDAQFGLYRSLLADKRMLVLLDNARDTQQVTPLLPGSPTCTVLVTSRDQLAGLITAHGAHSLAVDVLDERDARDLLAHRLGQRRLDAEPAAVADLLARCAGLPLALGIMAGRATAHPGSLLADRARELRDATNRLAALDWGDPTASLPAVLSSSYDALSAEQAMVFELLALAPGLDIDLPAAANLTGLPAVQTGYALRALAEISLLQQYTPGRYRMHDLIRLHVTERAQLDRSSDDRDMALRRLVDYYTHTAFTGERLLDPHRPSIELATPAPGCRPQPLSNETAALKWFEAEHACLLAIQQFAAEVGWHRSVWQLAWALNSFHNLRGRLPEQLAVSRHALAAARELEDPAGQVLSHRRLGSVLIRLGRHGEAMDHLQHALGLAEDTGDIVAQAHTHQVLATAWAQQDGHVQQALEHASLAVRLVQDLDDEVWEADTLNAAGWLHARLGQCRQARAQCEVALALFRRHSSRDGEATTLDTLGYIAQQSDQHTEALAYYRQALDLLRDIGDAYHEAETLDRIGQVHAALGESADAHQTWRQAFRLYQAQHRAAEADRIHRRLQSQL
ncbi:tetratricopeptide repeat protein [Nonomuraea sp. B19D2]|uniref:ATP-binding protein n=1 Tax=Nonomuraea sp. B19D2 TaxID=3159561 RepID=UPI0032DB7BC5